MNLKSYQDLEVWQKAINLVILCYQISKSFPKNETYGLISQLQRAAVSIPTNIAEGHARQSSKEFLHFISISYGSLAELETLILIAYRLDYIDDKQSKQLMNKTTEIGRMINGLRKSIKKKLAPEP